MPRKDDFLSAAGMSPVEQHAAEMNAAAVPASDFEGEYDAVGTYNSPAAQRLQRLLWESRMRQQTGIPKEEEDNG
jgi:hypothetical protein